MLDKKIKNKTKRTLVKRPKIKSVSDHEVTNPVPEVLEIKKEEVISIIKDDKEILFLEKTEIQDDVIYTKSELTKVENESGFFKDFLNKKKLFLRHIPKVLIIVFLISSFYLFSKTPVMEQDLSKVAELEASEIVKLVGKIIILPTGEIPKVATITEEDINNLKIQPFFSNAKVGDKALVYSLSGKVILYNPSTNKIVEVANVDTDNKSGSNVSL